MLKKVGDFIKKLIGKNHIFPEADMSIIPGTEIEPNDNLSDTDLQKLDKYETEPGADGKEVKKVHEKIEAPLGEDEFDSLRVKHQETDYLDVIGDAYEEYDDKKELENTKESTETIAPKEVDAKEEEEEEKVVEDKKDDEIKEDDDEIKEEKVIEDKKETKTIEAEPAKKKLGIKSLQK